MDSTTRTRLSTTSSMSAMCRPPSREGPAPYLEPPCVPRSHRPAPFLALLLTELRRIRTLRRLRWPLRGLSRLHEVRFLFREVLDQVLNVRWLAGVLIELDRILIEQPERIIGVGQVVLGRHPDHLRANRRSPVSLFQFLGP